MSQKIIWTIVVVALLLVGLLVWSQKTATPESPDMATTTPQTGSVNVQTDGTYALDTQKSSFGWTGSKTLIKEYFDHGTFAFSEGSVTVVGGNVVAGSFMIDMKSLSATSTGKGTGESMLTDHLKSEDFLDVAKYPVALIGIKNVTDGIVTADVTLKGITKEVSFPATISQSGDTLTGTASLMIDRTLWDIQYGSTKFFGDLGDSVISDSVQIDFTVVANRVQ